MLAAMLAASEKKIFVGLDEDNMRRLANDEPIRKELDEVPGLEGWILYILGPEDMARFIAKYRREGGHETT